MQLWGQVEQQDLATKAGRAANSFCLAEVRGKGLSLRSPNVNSNPHQYAVEKLNVATQNSFLVSSHGGPNSRHKWTSIGEQHFGVLFWHLQFGKLLLQLFRSFGSILLLRQQGQVQATETHVSLGSVCETLFVPQHACLQPGIYFFQDGILRRKKELVFVSTWNPFARDKRTHPRCNRTLGSGQSLVKCETTPSSCRGGCPVHTQKGCSS